jgi:hypothetical protein
LKGRNGAVADKDLNFRNEWCWLRNTSSLRQRCKAALAAGLPESFTGYLITDGYTATGIFFFPGSREYR